MKRAIVQKCLPALLLLVSFSVQADWNVSVGTTSSNGAWSGASPDVWTPSATGATVAASEINSRLGAGTPVTINTSGGGGAESGKLTVNRAVSWSANLLTLAAAGDIAIKAGLNGSGSASLALQYGQGAVAAGNAGNYILSNGAQVNLPAGTNFSTKLGSDGGTVNYTVITSLGTSASSNDGSLQGMVGALAGNFALGGNIDASGTNTWNAGAGFTPVGALATPFTGVFDGLGHTISGLTINNAGTDFQGLFGYSAGTLRNVGLLNSSISGRSGVATLAGLSNGAISYAYADGGSVTGNWGGSSAGGLQGGGSGSIGNSYANVSVTGANTGTGGLKGAGSGAVSNSYATGSVSGVTDTGGLVGQSSGNISNSYATGAVTGTTNTGGLVGNATGGTTSNSFWDKTTTGRATSAGAATGINTTALMQSQATFTGFDFGTTPVWRIYEGHSYPLLASFLTPLSVTASAASKTYDGVAYSGGNGVSYSTTPNANLLGTLSYGGTAQGAINVGSYTLIPSGYWSNQRGYDISFVTGSLSIAAVPYSPPSVVDVYSGGTATLSDTTPVTAAPGSTLLIPVGAAVAGTPITLSAPPVGVAAVPVTIKIGGNILTVAPLGGGTVLTVKSVTLKGVPTLVLLLSSGSVSISAAAGQPVIMYINGGLITAGNSGGTVSQTMNGDGTATLSVTSGEVVLPANAFAAIKDNKLYAGEVGRINADGKIAKVRLGSADGKGGLAGDPLTLAKQPAGLSINTVISRLSGTPGRLAEGLETVVATALGGSGTQNASGTLVLGGSAPRNYLPLGDITVDTDATDGVSTTADGLTRVVRNGVIVTLAPAPRDLLQFANDLTQAVPSATLTLRDGGVLLAHAGGRDYVLRFGAEVEAASAGGAFASFFSASDGVLRYRDSQGSQQALHPAFLNYPATLALAEGLSSGASAVTNADGSITVMLGTDRFTLVPDLALTPTNADMIPHIFGGQKWWLGDDGRVYLSGNGGVQGLMVK